MPNISESLNTPPSLYERRKQAFLNPNLDQIDNAIRYAYSCDENDLQAGWPEGFSERFAEYAIPESFVVVGLQAGDEGKGRAVLDVVKQLSDDPDIQNILAIRYQGGNNAGHTVVYKGERIATHAIPAAILLEKVIAVLDRGTIVHPADLQTEFNLIQARVQDRNLINQLWVSEEAILGTDIHRALEVIQSIEFPEAGGGTGRGIAVAYADHYNRTGLTIRDLLKDDWEEKLTRRYIYLDNLCKGIQKADGTPKFTLADILIPDFAATKREGSAQKMRVGSLEEFIARMEEARTWLKESHIVMNMRPIHQEIIASPDKRYAIVFEGTQGVAIGSWLGSYPDVTASDPSAYGVLGGTGVWHPFQLLHRLGGMKILYMSDVGRRTTNTRIDLPMDCDTLAENATIWQRFAMHIRKKAHEYGTTTGRPRKINFLDIPMLQHNIDVSLTEGIIATMLDVASEDFKIRVCVAYRNKKTGKLVPFTPGEAYQDEVEPVYRDFDGWNGEACKGVRNFRDLPVNARRFIVAIQSLLHTPIIALTNGPAEGDIIKLPGYPVSQTA